MNPAAKTPNDPAPVWPAGVLPRPPCPVAECGDMVRLPDTVGCKIHSAWQGMCPCAAVIGGLDETWQGYDDRGDALP